MEDAGATAAEALVEYAGLALPSALVWRRHPTVSYQKVRPTKTLEGATAPGGCWKGSTICFPPLLATQLADLHGGGTSPKHPKCHGAPSRQKG